MELIKLYCLITYLFTFGICVAGFQDAKDAKVLTGMITHLIFAPITTPVCLGWLYYEKSEWINNFK